jgi:sugar lactone lactonase YvrE
MGMFWSNRKSFLWLSLILLTGCAKSTNVSEQVIELVWPNPPDDPRIRFVRTLSSIDEFGKSGSWVDRVFGEGKSSILAKPYGVTTDLSGKVYVTDSGQGAVWVFDEENAEVRLLGISGQGKLVEPIGVAVDNTQGIVFVSDVRLQRVFGYDPEGELAVAIGKQGEFDNPSGLAVDESGGRLYVADPRNHRIRVYGTSDGEFLFEFGQRGSEEGEMNFPTNLFVSNRKLYITDTGNFRIQIFDLDGNYLGGFGKVGDSPGQLARPKGVAVDKDGHIYIVDAAFDNFQIFDEEGRLYLFVGSAGHRPGYFWLPAGIHIDHRDRIYVADSYNRRIQVFQYLPLASER